MKKAAGREGRGREGNNTKGKEITQDPLEVGKHSTKPLDKGIQRLKTHLIILRKGIV